MNITINEELRKYIDPLTENERISLERSILTEGCRDALVLWGEVLIDGHNRYEICQKHGITFNTVQNTGFETLEDVMLWMIDNQLSRRSVTDFQRGMLALRKKELIALRIQPQSEQKSEPNNDIASVDASTPSVASASAAASTASRKEVAKIAGVSSHTIGQIEKIQKTATPELIEAVRAGTISISAAAAVASLPSEEQVVAVAGGKKELQQAARQVREAKAPVKPAREESSAEQMIDTMVSTETGSEVVALKAQIAELQAENGKLKEQISMLTMALEDTKRVA